MRHCTSGLEGEFSVKNSAGFTLVEIITVLALLGIILSIIFSLIFFSFNNFKMQNERTEILSDLRLAMDYLLRQMRKAELVEMVDQATLKIDSDLCRIVDQSLFQGEHLVQAGIHELSVAENDNEITIGLVIIDGKGKEHDLFSSFVSREWEI